MALCNNNTIKKPWLSKLFSSVMLISLHSQTKFGIRIVTAPWKKCHPSAAKIESNEGQSFWNSTVFHKQKSGQIHIIFSPRPISPGGGTLPGGPLMSIGIIPGGGIPGGMPRPIIPGGPIPGGGIPGGGPLIPGGPPTKVIKLWQLQSIISWKFQQKNELMKLKLVKIWMKVFLRMVC